MPGPPPKRSTQRRRRNKPDVEITRAESDGTVRGPKLVGTHSAVARRWYEALRRSGQAQFFEPSDWAAAELVVLAIDAYVKKPSAMILQAITSAQTNLLVTEGDRRRLRVELERAPAAEGDAADAEVTHLDDVRRRLQRDA